MQGVRNPESYERGFKFAMGMSEQEPLRGFPQDYNAGIDVAVEISAMLGGPKNIKKRLNQAAKMQAAYSRMNGQIEDRPPPCSNCALIAICCETALTCGVYRRYTGMGEMINARVPDKPWAA